MALFDEADTSFPGCHGSASCLHIQPPRPATRRFPTSHIFATAKVLSLPGKGRSRHILSKPLHTPSSTHLILHGRPSDKLVAVEIQSLQELPTHRILETDHFYILDTHTRSGQSQSHACSPILSLKTHSTKRFCIPSQPSSRPYGSRWSIEHSSLG